MTKEKEQKDSKETTKKEKSEQDVTKKKSTKTNSKKTGDRKQDGSKAIQKETSLHEGGKGSNKNKDQVKKKQEDDVNISPFVSNVDGDIYAITNLPEEFIATLFAWVSRSPKSFKEHLKQAIKEYNVQVPKGKGFEGLSDRAKKFHEKWTVDYGHSSVAENAVAHVGIEKISRLASSELELANNFLSLTEYSQRYQKPQRNGWHNPLDKRTKLHKEVESFFNKTFDAFEQLIEGVLDYLVKKETNNGKKSISEKRLKELEKLAFEDARYVLPLAMHTQLGMTANGRAWRDALAKLGTSDHKESRELADNIRTEITKVLPVLLKHAEPSQYQTNSKKRARNALQDKQLLYITQPNPVYLQAVLSEKAAINHIVALLAMKHKGVSYSEGASFARYQLTDEKKEQIIKDLLHEMDFFDHAPDEFRHIHYNLALLCSEAAWHQLLRHNRATDFTYSKPSPHFGITIPPRIQSAGLEDIVKGIAEESKELYNRLVEEGFEFEAEYVVLNAHRRQVYMTFSLWEAYHLINLRTSEEAQWDIRNIFNEVHDQIRSVHPLLISQAKRRQ